MDLQVDRCVGVQLGPGNMNADCLEKLASRAELRVLQLGNLTLNAPLAVTSQQMRWLGAHTVQTQEDLGLALSSELSQVSQSL